MPAGQAREWRRAEFKGSLEEPAPQLKAKEQAPQGFCKAPR